MFVSSGINPESFISHTPILPYSHTPILMDSFHHLIVNGYRKSDRASFYP